MLLYNRLAASRMDKKESRAFFEEIFMGVFRNGALIDVGANYLLLNDAEFLR